MLHQRFFIAFSFFIILTSCHSYESIYGHQKKMFIKNESLFSKALKVIKDSAFQNDITISNSDFTKIFGRVLADSLKALDIIDIEYRLPRTIIKSDCRDIMFNLGAEWENERFSVLCIWNASCDERSRDGYHWKMAGSDHKHSFGFGNGWFLYTDSDWDP